MARVGVRTRDDMTSDAKLPDCPHAALSENAVPRWRRLVVPSAANVHSEAGAIAFARFFTAEVDRSFVTLDARFLKARSLPTCEGCALVIGTIAENHQDVKKQQAPSFRIKGATIEGSRSRTVVLWLPTDVIRVPFHNSQGEANGEVQPQSVTWQVGLDWTDGGWMVSEFAPVAR